jgi:hypothetical protein
MDRPGNFLPGLFCLIPFEARTVNGLLTIGQFLQVDLVRRL